VLSDNRDHPGFTVIDLLRALRRHRDDTIFARDDNVARLDHHACAADRPIVANRRPAPNGTTLPL
jgi:hypothetical protein